jgi:hypothetical protein
VVEALARRMPDLAALRPPPRETERLDGVAPVPVLRLFRADLPQQGHRDEAVAVQARHGLARLAEGDPHRPVAERQPRHLDGVAPVPVLRLFRADLPQQGWASMVISSTTAFRPPTDARRRAQGGKVGHPAGEGRVEVRHRGGRDRRRGEQGGGDPRRQAALDPPDPPPRETERLDGVAPVPVLRLFRADLPQQGWASMVISSTTAVTRRSPSRRVTVSRGSPRAIRTGP